MTEEAADYEEQPEEQLLPASRMTFWDFVACGTALAANLVGAFAAFWSQVTNVLAMHSNYKNERKALVDSVRMDLERL